MDAFSQPQDKNLAAPHGGPHGLEPVQACDAQPQSSKVQSAGCTETWRWRRRFQQYWFRYLISFSLSHYFFFIGIAYDFPDSGGYGGNTTTAEACRKVLRSAELRERLVSLCPDLYKEAFRHSLFNDLVIL